MFLDQILEHKRSEVIERKAQLDSRVLQDMLVEAPAVRPFARVLRRNDGRMGLIAEIKKASPSAGIIQPNFDPVRQAREYQAAGADCLSILTDERFFQGSLDYLRAARAQVAIGCLRKDFTVDEFQILEARAAGADAVLLIVAALTPAQLTDFAGVAHGLGMDVLVEVHTEAEMEIAAASGAKLIGINSRNLKTFEVDLTVIERLASLAPPDAILVGESGVKTRADVDRLRAARIAAILVGETLMRAGDVAMAVTELVG
jgi:indole-3-glycerol phosphate synthase